MAKRDLSQLIEQLTKVIPYEKLYEASGLLKAFDIALENIPYTAPECMGDMWGLIASALEKQIGPKPTEDWHWKILSIWMVKTEDELKGMFK